MTFHFIILTPTTQLISIFLLRGSIHAPLLHPWPCFHLSPSISSLLSAPHHLSHCCIFFFFFFYSSTVRMLSASPSKGVVAFCSSASWLDVLLQLVRGHSHASRKGQLCELQSWAPHISYSLRDLLRALHQICLSSWPTVTHISTPCFIPCVVSQTFILHLTSHFSYSWCFFLPLCSSFIHLFFPFLSL